MKYWCLFSCWLLLYACTSSPYEGLPRGGAPMATVNGTTITEGELAFLAEIGPPQLKTRLRSREGRAQVVQDLIDRELLYAESIARRLDRDPHTQAQVEVNRRTLIATAVLQVEITAAARHYYEAHHEELMAVPLHHLLVRFGTDAGRGERAALATITMLKQRIEAGESFTDLAKQASDDAITKPNGGYLGKVTRAEPRLVRRGYDTILEQAFLLRPDKVAGPFKTVDGYHLLFTAESPRVLPFERVADELEMRVRDEVRGTLLKRLRDKAVIVVHENPTK